MNTVALEVRARTRSPSGGLDVTARSYHRARRAGAAARHAARARWGTEPVGHTVRGPRPLLLQTGDADYWSDPKGEYLAAVAASPVWKLFGTDGLTTDHYPASGEPVLSTLGYSMHAGRHGILAADWPVFLEFLERHLVTKTP